MRLSAVRVQRGVARSWLVVVVMRVQARVRGGLLSDPLPRWLHMLRECVRGGGSVVVLLLVDGDMEALHAGVQGVPSHRDGHWFARVDHPTRFTLLLLLVLHRHHIDLLFILIVIIFII